MRRHPLQHTFIALFIFLLVGVPSAEALVAVIKPLTKMAGALSDKVIVRLEAVS